MLVDLFGYLYMAVIVLFSILAMLFLLMIPISGVMSFIDSLRGKEEGGLSDSFINFWSAHSDN
jgi:hypothetical protein